MISDRAKSIAARRIGLMERQWLLGQDRFTGTGRSEPDLERRVAAHLLRDGEGHRSRDLDRKLTKEQADFVADRLAGLEWRAVVAEVGLARVRGRRLFRVGSVLAGMLRRPWRVFGLLGDLRGAFVRRELPVLPERRSRDVFLAELGEVTADAPEPRLWSYPHVRVAHVGGLRMFGGVAPHFELSDVDVEVELGIGFDMLLIEPGVGDPLEGLEPGMVGRFRDAGVPVLLVARMMADLDYPVVSEVDLVVCEDPDLARQASGRGLAVLRVDPSVDETVHNPIGWKREPDSDVLVLADHPGIGSDLELLAPFADQVSVYGAGIPGLDPAEHHPQRPVGSDQAGVAKGHVAAFSTPQLTATPTSHVQTVLELVAAGTPVIAAPDPTLASLLDGHYLPADTIEDVRDHLKALLHPPTRERHSVPARRHVLTRHTRKHRFEEILTHLDIPTIPTPRISILLATKRPENIEHALANITRQDWPNKELLLILHGPDDFDLDQIHTVTSRLPYPTQIIPCPEAWTLGDCLNSGLDHATGSYITKMDDDDHYGPHHLIDIHTAHTYSNADITGKLSNIVYFEGRDLSVDWRPEQQERFGSYLPGPTVLISRDCLRSYRFCRVSHGVDSTLWKRVRSDGMAMFSTHRFGFVRVRRADQTFQRGDAALVGESGGNLRRGLNLENSMI